jgi:predicted peptidase
MAAGLGLWLGACSTGDETAQDAAKGTTDSIGHGGRQQTEVSAADDPALTAILDEVQSKFVQESFADAETGVTLEYNLFVPDGYDPGASYPLIAFIHDDSVTGKDVEAALTQGYGGVIWATAEEQAKHASFVLAPEFATSTIEGGIGQSGEAVVEAQVNTFLHLLDKLQTDYSIDPDRLYGTGQSMGCMTMFYLNGHYPDLFAATLYVAGQWDVAQLEALRDEAFFYIVAAGDDQASGGQGDLKASFDSAGVAYSTTELDATWDEAQSDEAVEAVLAEGTGHYFAAFAKGTVLSPGQRTEHVASFNHGYTIPAVRDWLFTQTRL